MPYEHNVPFIEGVEKAIEIARRTRKEVIPYAVYMHSMDVDYLLEAAELYVIDHKQSTLKEKRGELQGRRLDPEL